MRRSDFTDAQNWLGANRNIGRQPEISLPNLSGPEQIVTLPKKNINYILLIFLLFGQIVLRFAPKKIERQRTK